MNHSKKRLLVLSAALTAFLLIPAHAGDLGSSTVVTGTKQLISDITTVLHIF